MLIIRYIFFDTETSGLDCRNCRIIELAMLTVEDGEVIDTYDEFIDIGEALSPKVIELTGITNEILRTEGINEKIVAEDLKKRLTKGTTMVAHNCQFDLLFVYFLLKRYFPSEADKIVSNVGWIDTVSILKDRKDYPHKLIDAVHHYDIEEVNFHRAIDDTKALYEVARAMKRERDDILEYVNVFGYNPKYGAGLNQFSFIKYKPQPYHNCGKLDSDKILPRR